MYKKRLFNVLVAISFVIATALSVREVFATTNILSSGNATEGTKVITCTSLPSRYSLHTDIVNETGTRLTYTDDGPTGVDGGLIYLLSTYRTCSK